MSKWIEWYGGECPVDGSVEVEVRLVGGIVTQRLAGSFWWATASDLGGIRAYRVLAPNAEDTKLAPQKRPMHEKYPAYFKDVSHLTSVDVYRMHRLFEVNDPVIHHASKKLLMAGSRTGEKFEIDDIREARDSLTRWLDMEEEDRR